MSKKLSNELSDVDVRYGHILQVVCDWVDTTVMLMVCGRGTAKSTVIQARRIYRCVKDMPGAPLAIVANTYSNLDNNIMPAVYKGWQLMGWIEGVHYIKGKRPPETWRRRCSIIVDEYEHVISFWNGSVLFLGSLDNPSLLAGKSVVHLFFDEAKYAKEAKANRALPILRGDAITYGHCHLFLGLTITTDMPDIDENEDDWYFRYFAEMDPDLVEYIVQAASIRNDILVKIQKENRRIINEFEKKRKRKNVPESEYLTTMKDPGNAVEFDDLHTFFFTDSGTVHSVDGVTFSVPIGKTVGVVGESGCGKSVTSLSLMQLVQRPQGQIVSGEIRLNMGDKAYEISKVPQEKMQTIRGNVVSMIFQEPMTSLNPVFRIGDQVDEVIALHDGEGKSKEEIKQQTIRAGRIPHVSPRTVGRHAAEGHDRHVPCLQSPGHHRG